MIRSGPVAQPANTLTSLAYVVAGLQVGRSREAGPAGRVFGALLAGVGLGSVAFHGAATAWGKWLHDRTIVAMALFVAAWDAKRAITCRRHGMPLREIGRDLALTHAAMAGVLAVGAAVALSSRTGAPLCRPRSLLQGHGVWHVLTAIALAMWAEAAFTPAVPVGESPLARPCAPDPSVGDVDTVETVLPCPRDEVGEADR